MHLVPCSFLGEVGDLRGPGSIHPKVEAARCFQGLVRVIIIEEVDESHMELLAAKGVRCEDNPFFIPAGLLTGLWGI